MALMPITAREMTPRERAAWLRAQASMARELGHDADAALLEYSARQWELQADEELARKII